MNKKLEELKRQLGQEKNKRNQILEELRNGTIQVDTCEEILNMIKKRIQDYNIKIRQIEEEVVGEKLMSKLCEYEREQDALIEEYRNFLLSTFRTKIQTDLNPKEEKDSEEMTPEEKFNEASRRYEHRDKTFIFNSTVDKMQEYAEKGYRASMPKYLIGKLRKRIKPFIQEKNYQDAVNAGFVISETEAINDFLFTQRYDIEDLEDLMCDHFRKSEHSNRKIELARQEKKQIIMLRLSEQINNFLKDHIFISEICNILSQNMSNKEKIIKDYLKKYDIMFANEEYLKSLIDVCEKLASVKTQVDIAEEKTIQDVASKMLKKTRTRNTLSGIALYATSAMCMTYAITNGYEISTPIAEVAGVATGVATAGSIVSKTKSLRR